MNLFNAVTGWLYQQQRKHGLEDFYAEEYLNKMTNFEFLQAISDALEEMKNIKED